MRKKDFAKRGLSVLMAVAMTFSNMGSLPNAFASESATVFETEMEETDTVSVGEPQIETVKVEEPASEERSGFDGATENSGADTDVETVEVAVDETTETYSVAIDIGTLNGTVTATSDAFGGRTAVLEKNEDGEFISKVTGTDGSVTETVLDEENPFALILKAQAGSTVHVKAEADDGYVVGLYTVENADGEKEGTAFKEDAYSAFEYDVVADADKIVTVYFTEADEDIEVESESVAETEKETTQSEIGSEAEETTAVEETEATEETEAVSETEAEAVETEIESEIESETEIETESETETEIETETESESESETEETEHFLEKAEGVEKLNADDFASMRLVVMTADEDEIIDEEHLIAMYDTIYLLQYGSVEQTMNAFVYYEKHSDAVEPDKTIGVASDEDVSEGENDIEFTEEQNPLASLSAEEDILSALENVEETVQTPHYGGLVALIDTGASGPNVVGQVSLIDEAMVGNGHANEMASAMASVDPEVQIVSIRAMDDGGRGTISSVVAGIEYAINCGASFINLSMYAKKSLLNSVLEQEIQKAVAAGITVVAAAGNDGADASGYIPGFINAAYVIGACDENGARIPSSNYGATVDYNVVANSTSEAAAKFAGYLSMYGFLRIQEDVNSNGLIFSTDYVKTDEDEEDKDARLYIQYDFFESGFMGDNGAPSVAVDTVTLFTKNLSSEDEEYYEFLGHPYHTSSDANALRPYVVRVEHDGNVLFGDDVITSETVYDETDGTIKIPKKYFEKGSRVYIGIALPASSEAYSELIENGFETANSGHGVSEGSDTGYGANASQAAGATSGTSVSHSTKSGGEEIAELKKGDIITVTSGHVTPKSNWPWQVTISGAKYATGKLKGKKCSWVCGSFYATGCIDKNGDSGSNWNIIPGNGSMTRSNIYIKGNPSVSKNGTVTVRAWCGVQVYGGQNQGGWVTFTAKYNPKHKVSIKKTVDGSYAATTKLGGSDNPIYANLSATYAVYDKSNKKVGTLSTKADGTASNDIELAPGTYYLKETTAPANYALNTAKVSFKVDDKDLTGKNAISVKDRPSSAEGTAFTKVDPRTKDSNYHGPIGSQDMSRSSFTLEYWAAKNSTAGSPSATWTFKPDSLGKMDFSDSAFKVSGNYIDTKNGRGIFPIGTYRLRETEPALGFNGLFEITGRVEQVGDTEKAVWKWDNNNSYIPDTKLILENNALYTSVDVKKAVMDSIVPQGDITLEGIKFGVYNKSILTVYDSNEVPYAPGSEISSARMTTDANGNATSPAILPVGKYEIREIETNEGLKKTVGFLKTVIVEETGTYPNKHIVKTEVGPDGYTPLQDSTAYNDAVRGGISVPKIDKMLGRAHDHGDTDLSGAEFTIVNASKAFVLKKDRKTRVETAPSLKGKKKEEVNYAQIKAAIDADKNCVAAVIKTDKTGHASTASDELVYGTYFIIETAPPTKGYHLNTTWYDRIEVRKDGEIYSTTECPDQIYRGGAKIKKFDYMRDTDKEHGDADLSGAEFLIVNASLDLSMNEAKSEIPTSGIKNDHPTYAQVKAAAEKSTMQKLITDKTGFAQTSDQALPYGTYYVIETKAPNGYLLNEKWVGRYVVREDKKMYNPEVIEKGMHDESNHPDNDQHDLSGDALLNLEGHEYAVNDQIVRGGILIPKYDKELDSATPQGIASLRLAEFTIVNASKASVRNKDGKDVQTAKPVLSDNPTWSEVKAAINDDNVVQVITTNAEGVAKTGKKDLPYGTYFVIETKASYGYFLDDTFVGKIVIRDDGAFMALDGSVGNSSFKELHERVPDRKETVDQQPRRGDITFRKTNIDGKDKAYIPFLISAVKIDEETGLESVLEQHVVFATKTGYVNTASKYRKHSYHTNEADKYVKNEVLTEEGEEILAKLKAGESDADTWGIWFEGNSNSAPKTPINDDFGALYPCYYTITEVKCSDNADYAENLMNLPMVRVYNNDDDPSKPEGNLYAPMVTNASNWDETNYFVIVDTEIKVESLALDLESRSKTLPVREAAAIRDTVNLQHVSSDHDYRITTKFVDVTDGMRELKIVGTDDEDVTISPDGVWLQKEFRPDKISGTNSTNATVSLSGKVNTIGREGHRIMAVDYVYEYAPVSEEDNVRYDWHLVKTHPDTSDQKQMDAQSVYVPDLKTTARDVLTQSRVGAKSADDAIYDIVQCYNLSENQVYTLRMKLVDAETGAEMGSGEVGIDSKLGIIWQPKASDDPSDEMRVYDCSEVMKPYAIDSSNFKDNQAVVVIESLYRANGRTGEPIGEPIVTHDSLLDEKETIRYVDVCTSASDGNTADDVGTSEKAATVYDNVKLSNLVFDDSDDPTYSYTIKGRLIYQKDFTDADGVSHKAGDEVETLDGTKNIVTVTSDAAGNAVCTYEDGSLANWNLDAHRYGFNVAKRAGGAAGDNSYVEDNTAGIVDMTVEMIYKVDSTKLEGGTVVVYEYLYHDATGANEAEVAKHEDIRDKGQTVHYPHVRTSAADGATKDDVGAELKEASIVDTVKLWNLVPGRTYIVSGKLVEQNEGTNENPVDFLVNGKPVTQEASITVTEDGKIVSGNGEKTTVTNYDADLNEVDGTVDLTFTFDASELQDRTCVVFEDLYHNGVKVAVHNDLRDEGQTIHFPKIRTHANDGYTGDRVATVTGEAVIVDTVDYVNLVPGREYTLKGVLMRQDNGEPLIDSAGNEVTASRTFTAGETGDGIVVSELNEELNKVSGTVDITFKFDASLLEDTTTVAFEYLEHNKIEVTTHTEITDKPQSDHFPKLRTSAFDKEVGDEVGKVDKTTIVDTVRFWNLIPGMTYEISGTLMDKDTGKPFEENGQVVTQKVTFTVPMNDDSETFDAVDSAGNHTEARITHYSEELERIDGNVDLKYEIDASNLEGKTLVVFEDLLHNKVKVTTHADLTDLAQTIHFPKIRTTAVDDRTGDDAGTVTETATIIDTVKYFNLVIGKKYEIKGTLMNQETGLPIIGSDGKPVTAEASFVATRESSELNKVTNVNEDNYVVDGEYVIKFTLDSTLLAGKTVVVFEDLYHNEVKVTSHADITDEEQSIHYPEIRTTAFDVNTNDHVGTIWGSFINGVRRALGQKNSDGTEIEDVRLARITDTVELDNLVPGLTYVVSGKLYNVDESKENGTNVPLVIDGQEIVQAVTITVTSDGRIEALDGSRTTVTKFDAEKHSVDGTVDLVYSLDSSKIQGTKLVVFEKLYQDVTYTSVTEPTSVEEEDVIHKHEDIDDEGQSVSEVGIRTTAVDIKTGNHVGSEPGAAGDGPSIIKDEVNLSKLIPDMEYEIEGVLVDIDASDFENEKAMYLKADGTLTADRAEAYKETLKFTADGEEEVKELFFSIASDKVQGKTLTVFENLLHAGVVVSSHPAGDGDGWAEEDFAAQTVYYPTGKTNATDNETGVHSSFAEENRIVTDRVYFENLLVGENYEISGQLVYAEDFVGADGTAHSAGEPVTGETRTVKFTASEDLTEAQYDGSAFEIEGMSPTAIVDSLTVKTCANGQKTISGYVSIEFAVNAANLAGATLVAFEEFSNNGVPVFVHKNLKDLPQTVKIPAIRTRARSLDLDEAAVFDENGNYRDIEIIDTVEYRNLWTAAELAEMTEQGKDIRYEDGTAMGHSSAIYLISESAGYVLKGVLMDKETGEPLKNAAGEIYEAYSEPFVPETPNGTHEVKFIVNAGDFIDAGGESALEGKTAVVFEDLFIADGPDEIEDSTHVAEHHDIDDEEQDIRFPKGRTHATDAVSNNEGKHDEENSTTSHEALASENVVINDLVSFENLHGGTKYEVTGRLQVITGYDEAGIPNAWEAAKDDAGNEITATATLDTSSLSEDFNASVSGQILITFTFSGRNLAGKTTVAFETFEREGVPVMVHADVSDEAQTVFLPKIHTNASDAISGLDEAFAGAGTVILDKVTYENLELGKVYKLRAVLHKKSNGAEIEGTEVEGTFTAGVENQFILRTGTVVGTIDEIRSMISSENVSKETPVGGEATLNPTAGNMSSRASGEVCVLIPVDASALEGDAVVAFETLWAQEDEANWKEIAEHEDIDDEDQTVKIPRIRTKAAIDGAKSVVAGKTSTVVDTVEYKNLTPGHKYIVKGELINKADGARTEVKADTEFTPKTPDGTVEVKFTFDSSKFAGCQLVVYEELESYSDNYDTDTFNNDSEKTWKVAEHKDIEDEAQTVTIEKPNNPGQPTEKIQTGDVFRITLLVTALIALALLALLQVQKKKRRMI